MPRAERLGAGGAVPLLWREAPPARRFFLHLWPAGRTALSPESFVSVSDSASFPERLEVGAGCGLPSTRSFFSLHQSWLFKSPHAWFFPSLACSRPAPSASVQTTAAPGAFSDFTPLSLLNLGRTATGHRISVRHPTRRFRIRARGGKITAVSPVNIRDRAGGRDVYSRHGTC